MTFRLRQIWWLAHLRSVWVAAVAVVGTAVWVAEQHPETVAHVGWLSFGVSIGLGAWAGWALGDSIVLWPHRRDRINPLGWAVRFHLGYDDDVPATHFIHWDPNFGEQGTEIRVYLPRHWIGSDKQREQLLRAVRAKGRFGEGDINHEWILDGRFGYLQVTPREKLIIPQRVPFAEVSDLLAQTVSGHHLLALGAGGRPIRGDLDGDAPHIGISMPTGRGKTNTIKGVIAQEMHLGASTVILDYKRRSLKCFKGVEGVTYCRDIGEIHNALIKLAREAMDRNVLADELEDDEEPPWQRRMVVMEEQNTTITKLMRYWQQIRERDDPNVSPAVDAYEELLNMGRQVNVHVVACFVKLTARKAGGTENRDQFGMVPMAGFKPATWKMLADEIPRPSTVGKPKGRTWYVCDGEAPEGQAVLWTDKEAREWAASGVSSKVRAGGVKSVSQGKQPARRAGRPALTVVDGGAERQLYTLRQASSDEGVGIVPETHQRLRGLRSGDGRDPEFPDHDHERGQAKLYYAETLQRYSRNREQVG